MVVFVKCIQGISRCLATFHTNKGVTEIYASRITTPFLMYVQKPLRRFWKNEAQFEGTVFSNWLIFYLPNIPQLTHVCNYSLRMSR